MNPTDIEWADFVCNPWRQKCKKHCWYCYAWKQYPRFGRYVDDPGGVHQPTLDKMLSRQKPVRIFMGSMTDLLGEWVPSAIIKILLEHIRHSNRKQDAAGRKRHTFIFLTKNPKRYLQFDWPSNCWLGATATDQSSWTVAMLNLWRLKKEKGNTIFISCEPLLSFIHPMGIGDGESGIMPDWVIVGAMTGQGSEKHRPEKAWVDAFVQLHEWGKGTEWGVRIFFKENLNWPEEIQEYPSG